MRWVDSLLRLRALLFRQRNLMTSFKMNCNFIWKCRQENNQQRDLSTDEAKRQARLQFGSVERTTEECREARGVNFFETLWADTRYALRGMRRSPLFAVTIIAIISVGLGLNTAIFTIFDAYVLRPLAVRDPDSLFRLRWTDHRGNDQLFTWKQFEELQSYQNGRALGDAVCVRAHRQSADVRLVSDREFLPDAGRQRAVRQNSVS